MRIAYFIGRVEAINQISIKNIAYSLKYTVSKKHLFYILNNLAKNEPISIVFWYTESRENFTKECLL